MGFWLTSHYRGNVSIITPRVHCTPFEVTCNNDVFNYNDKVHSCLTNVIYVTPDID